MDLVFLDTETLGLSLDSPIWEFSAQRYNNVEPGRLLLDADEALNMFIRHDPGDWLDSLPSPFVDDYRARYSEPKAVDEYVAAHLIHEITRGATIVGAVPSFDTTRIERLLLRHGFKPEWHYRLIDITAVALGYVATRASVSEITSDGLSRLVGVDPTMFDRHTAAGDVSWVKAQWNAMLGKRIQR